ncbi:uncharacterized protein LOC144142806 [Haemaphysalis longicornis]
MACEELRGDHGNVVAMAFPNGKVLAKIYSSASDKFVKCEKCGFVPETFYNYNCQHRICAHCATYGGSYLCAIDNITTQITKPAVPNAALKRAGLQCPACCEVIQWGHIRSHIQKEHPDLWKEGNAHTWSDTQASTSPESIADPVPLDIPGKASTSSEAVADPVPVDIPTQVSSSSEPHADPVALGIHTQQRQQKTSINETYIMYITRLHTTIYSLNEEIAELKSTVQKLMSADEEHRSTMAKYVEKLNNAITFRLDVDEVLRKHFRERQITPMFRHTWTLRPYSDLWQELVVNNATLSTGVLSVNTPGYKVELTISITGHTCEWRRPWLKDELCCPPSALHVAFMVRLHHGEEDDLLVWPFTNKIELALVNQLDDDKSIRQELESSEADAGSLKKPVPGTPNPWFGFPRVISVLKLHTPEEGFLFQDSIVFKLSIH